LNLPEFLARTLRRVDIPSAPVAQQGTTVAQQGTTVAQQGTTVAQQGTNNETAMVNKRQKTEGAKKTATTTP
jgi:hypothetical protein